MANKVNILPNLRIDIPDFEGATQEFADADNKERFQAVFQDRYAHVPEGFRVEIPDQGAFPGQVNVHNGLSFDRSGKLVTSGAAPDTQRSIVLTGTTVYYLEVEFTEESSFVDARAFWDPNFDNGTDPSGDVRASGREFNQNVATRKVPEWRIVSPVSTTGFEINSIPSSNKIPLAVIHVTANVVVDGGGPTPIPLRTSLKEDYPAGTTAIKVLNSRSMPQVFTCDIGAESISVTANDQDNGILTLAGVTVSSHIAGERVTVTGGAVYLPQRTDPKPPTFPGAGGTEDARPRLYSGDEEIGHAILQNADAGTGQSDAQIDNLKNYVDFLAGQIRQMKVGAARPENIGQTAPPFTFSPDFRYFEDAGGILGARTNTISVGDGVNTWGDYNTVQATSANLAIQGAIDAVPVGGIVYIKAGTYVLTSALSVTKPIRFVGDGHAVTIIDASAAATAFDLNTTGAVGLKDIGVTASGTAPYAMTITQCGPKSVFAGCSIEGVTAVACDQTRFVNCSFTTPGSGDDAINGIFTDCVFDQCSADCSIALAAARAVNLVVGSVDTTFTNCVLFASNPTPTSVVDVVARALFDTCRIPVPQDGEGMHIQGPNVTVRDCAFSQATSSAGTRGRGIRITDTVAANDKTLIRGNDFVDCDVGIEFDSGNAIMVSVVENKIECLTANRGRCGIHFLGNAVLVGLNISKNFIVGHDDDSGATPIIAGIWAPNTAATSILNTFISDNCINTLGKQFAANIVSVYGILIDTGNTTNDLSVTNNVVDNLVADRENFGIFFGNSQNARIRITGNSLKDIGSTAGGDLVNQTCRGIYLANWDNIVIANNVLNALGHVNAASVNGNQGIFIGANNVGSPNVNAAITGNVIDNLRHGGGFDQQGIYLTRNAGDVSISGNHIGAFSGNSIKIGIDLRAANGPSELMENISIANNVIRDVGEGIRVVLAGGSATELWENYALTGNVIDRFTSYGINFVGDNVQIPVSITGNSLATQSSATGIRVEDGGTVVVGTNSIYMVPFASSCIGIQLDNVNTASIVGNSVRIESQNDPDIGIDVVGSSTFSVCGNSVTFNTSNAGAIGVDTTASAVGTICGNMIRNYGIGGTSLVVPFLGYTMLSGNTCRGFIGGSLTTPGGPASPWAAGGLTASYDTAINYAATGAPNSPRADYYLNHYT